MNKFGMSVIGGLLALSTAGAVFGEEPNVTREEMDALKTILTATPKIMNFPVRWHLRSLID